MTAARTKTADARAADAVALLRQKADAKYAADLAPRYGIHSATAFGVRVPDLKSIAKMLGRDQALAEALWRTGLHDARMLSAYVAEPEKLTARLMDTWAGGFENWADTDTLCFSLFDQTKLAYGRIPVWAKRKDEFVRRAAFALLASCALHDKVAGDAEFLKGLALIEAASGDERNFVKKGVNWALRAIGTRKSPALKAAASETATRLAASADPTARWIGKDALRAFAKKA